MMAALSLLFSKLPTRVWIALLCVGTVVGGSLALEQHGKAIERRDQANRARAQQLAAQKDSLTMAADMGRRIAHEDSAASLDRAEAAERVREAQQVRQQRSHQVRVVNDTTVAVVSSSGADSTVTVAPQITTALNDAKTQIAADSLALKADSTKLETQAAKASNDSVKAVLATRIEDHAGNAEPEGDGSRLGNAAETGEKLVAVAAVGYGVFRVGRWVWRVVLKH